jgi:hypothetical protein
MRASTESQSRQENAPFEPFCTKNDHFTKTGSGQTKETLRKGGVFFLQAESCHAHSKTFDDSDRTTANCAKAFLGQRLVSRDPALSVYWHTEAQLVPIAQQCADIAALSQALGNGTLITGVDQADKTWHTPGSGCPPVPAAPLAPE